MPGITLQQAQSQLDLWLHVNEVISTGTSYQMGTRSLTRANSNEVLKQIDYWDKKVSILSSQAGKKSVNRIYRAIPTDF